MRTRYIVRKASHIGRGHLNRFVNKQDALKLFEGEIQGQQVVIGIICDGCSEGTSSETGAELASAFLVRESVTLLMEGVSSTAIPKALYRGLLKCLRQITDVFSFSSPADRVSFIKHTLLFTVMGFILIDEKVVVFTAGDGTIVLNDQVIHIDQDNHPMYPAYHLVERAFLENGATTLPTGFDMEVYNVVDLQRFAIGSDAWKEEESLISEIWGFKNPAGLQRRVNVWSENERHFQDDVSIITVEIITKASENPADTSQE